MKEEIERELRESLMENFEGVKISEEEAMERVRQHTIRMLNDFISKGYIPPVDVDGIKVKPKDNDPTVLTIDFPEELIRKLEER